MAYVLFRVLQFLRLHSILLLTVVLCLSTQTLHAQDEEEENDGKPKIRAMGVEANGVEVPI
ncbi:MAG: hypothetical protein RML40_06820, partial [Bacteroidota bacterium]|nr:hypothetical protein [Candidatus Kapabacteria bacterium]MDW8220229.1 hypothetical protein [Bacteroidota bacterium]